MGFHTPCTSPFRAWVHAAAMALPLSFLVPDRVVRLRIDGTDLTGTVLTCANGWLRLATPGGDTLVNLAQVAWIAGEGAAPTEEDDSGELPRPKAKEMMARPGSKAPGRPWSDDAVQAVVDGFLEDRSDAELAEQHNRTRHQVTVLRQAWECARGNIADDRLSPAAQLWIERIRRVMRPG